VDYFKELMFSILFTKEEIEFKFELVLIFSSFRKIDQQI